MEIIDVDILVMHYDDINYLSTLFESIKRQRLINVINFIVPILVSNEEKDNEIKNYCKDKGIITFDIESWYYSPLLTRQRVIKKYCTSKVVVSISSGVVPINDMAIYNLVKDVYNGNAAYSYGRQVSTHKRVEKYVKEKFFSIHPTYYSLEDLKSNPAKAVFSDDTFSCINRDIFLKLDGYQNNKDNLLSDLLYSYIILKAGYKKKYAGDAVAKSLIDPTRKQLKDKYYRIGLIHGELKELNNCSYFDKNSKITRYVYMRAIKDFNIIVLFTVIGNILTRAFNYRKGKLFAVTHKE